MMAKKTKRHGGEKLPPKVSQDQKGLNTSAFAVLPGLFSEPAQEDSAQQSLKTVVAVARVETVKKARYVQDDEPSSRLSEADIDDASGMSDMEIFLQSVSNIDRTDVLNRKFSEKLVPAAQSKAESGDRLTMTPQEREFALFTQEMALSNVKRIEEAKAIKASSTRKKNGRDSELIKHESQPASIDALWEQAIAAEEEQASATKDADLAKGQANAMSQAPVARVEAVASAKEVSVAMPQREVKTVFPDQPVGPAHQSGGGELRKRLQTERALGQVVGTSRQLVPHFKKQELGPNWGELRPDQVVFIEEIKTYEERFGTLSGLKLRGFALVAGLSRFEAFVAASFENKTRYGSLFFGDASSGKDVENQLREKILKRLKSDERILKFAPALDAENTFTTIYLAFVRH